MYFSAKNFFIYILTISQKPNKRRDVANDEGVKYRQVPLVFSVSMEWICVQSDEAPSITNVYNELCKGSGETSHSHSSYSLYVFGDDVLILIT